GHRQDGNVVVLDCLREWKPPFNPTDVILEASELLKAYRVGRISGDRYAGEWCRQSFRERTISYEVSAQSKGDIYINFLPQLTAGRLRLLDHQGLLGPLCSLERGPTGGTGRDVVDHPRGAHDDLANAVAGMAGVTKYNGYPVDLSWVSAPADDAAA